MKIQLSKTAIEYVHLYKKTKEAYLSEYLSLLTFLLKRLSFLFFSF